MKESCNALYIQNNIKKLNENNQLVEEMYKNVYKSFDENLKRLNWLDEITRNMIREKVDFFKISN